MYILGIESSTKQLSIAISKQDSLLRQIWLHKDMVFMTGIIPLIDSVLRMAKLELSQIDVFSVDIGPGDFTGTRIGISVARSFSMVNQTAVFGVPGLDIFAAGMLHNNISRILALQKKDISTILLPVIDVKHNELFFGIYRVNAFETERSAVKISLNGQQYYAERFAADCLADRNRIDNIFGDFILKAGLQDVSKGKGHAIFLGGTAFSSYRTLLNDIKKTKYNFILSKKSLFPEARFLNLCTFLRVMKEMGESGCGCSAGGSLKQQIKGDSHVTPLYVRDFIPFGKNNNKSALRQ